MALQRAFNRTTIRQTLVDGLIKPNPTNPSIPMWTVEHFDKPSPGTQYNIDCANNHPKAFPQGFQGILHENPLEEFRGLSIAEIDAKVNPQFQPEKVQVIDPHDLVVEQTNQTKNNDPNRPF